MGPTGACLQSDIAKMLCRVALPVCNPLHVKEVCVLPTLVLMGNSIFAYLEGVKWFNLCSSVEHLC